jgi:carbon monoxide dehydrogenase subunit G
VKIDGALTVAAPIAQVWQTFLDPLRLGRAVPGCEHVARLDETQYEAVLAVKVGFMTIRSRAQGALLEAREPHHLAVEMLGEPVAMAGAYRALLDVDLAARGGETDVRYTLDLTLLGRLAALGEAIVRATAGRLAGQFAENLAALFAASGCPAPEAAQAPREGAP